MAKRTTPRRLAPLGAAADRLAVHPRTVRRMIANGQLTGYRVGDRMVRVDMDEVDQIAKPIPAAG